MTVEKSVTITVGLISGAFDSGSVEDWASQRHRNTVHDGMDWVKSQML